MHEQNAICSKTNLDGTTHEQTIICNHVMCRSGGELSASEKKEKIVSNVDFLRLVFTSDGVGVGVVVGVIRKLMTK